MAKTGNLIAAAILALGMVIGGFLLGNGLLRADRADRSVMVRGLAEQDVVADLATWTISFVAQGSDFTTAKASAKSMEANVRDFLQDQQFSPDDIAPAGLSVYQRTNRNMPSVEIRQALRLSTSDIAKAEKAYAAQGALLERGVAIGDGGRSIVYSFTGLTALKPDMIAAATKDARAAAEQFARDSGAGVGGIKSASQGYFSIQPRDGAVGSAGDLPQQKVRVVTTVNFYLTD